MDKQIKASKKSDQFFWRENFESFEPEEAKRYNDGVTKSAFTLNLYDKLMEYYLHSILDKDRKLHILDAGGGTGKWSIYFARMGHKVTMMDVAEPMLELARQEINREELQNLITIEKGDIADLSYADHTFDFVFSDRNPISHCGKKDRSYQAISECYRVLKPNGYLLGCVLNRMRKVAQMAMELDLDKALGLIEEGELQRSDNGFTHYYTETELESILNNNNFHNIKIWGTTIVTELIPTAWLLDEIPLKRLLQLEMKLKDYSELKSYGVRFHFMAIK